LELKAAHAAKNIAGCDEAQEKLNAALQAASADIQAAMQGDQGGDQPGSGADGEEAGADDVTDVDFEEVK
ncbi:molecular chaperone DnaK, partial [bacterium]|nr:molecular chaperone DnaK [bacterium]